MAVMLGDVQQAQVPVRPEAAPVVLAVVVVQLDVVVGVVAAAVVAAAAVVVAAAAAVVEVKVCSSTTYMRGTGIFVSLRLAKRDWSAVSNS